MAPFTKGATGTAVKAAIPTTGTVQHVEQASSVIHPESVLQQLLVSTVTVPAGEAAAVLTPLQRALLTFQPFQHTEQALVLGCNLRQRSTAKPPQLRHPEQSRQRESNGDVLPNTAAHVIKQEQVPAAAELEIEGIARPRACRPAGPLRQALPGRVWLPGDVPAAPIQEVPPLLRKPPTWAEMAMRGLSEGGG